MSRLLLTQLALPYADSITFENSGSTFNIKMSNKEFKLLILMKNILKFNFSKDALESDEDYMDLVDITHEYRKPNQHDLRNYLFFTGNINHFDKLPPLHIITLYGNTYMEIICEDVEVKELA